MIVKNYILNLYTILLLTFFLDWCSGVTVTELSVPLLVDPRDALVLGCTYDMDGEELHSVKWYKDEQEFFRYTPRQQPYIISFPVVGVHLDQQQEVACNIQQCNVQLTHLNTQHSGGAYKCEVSSEAPKFRVGFRTGNVTVAAVGRTKPQVLGVRDVYAVGSLVQASCTAAAADPAPTLTWLLNGGTPPPGAVSQQSISIPDSRNLVIASRDLRFLTESKHFLLPGHLFQLVCVATIPLDVPAPPLTSLPVTARLLDPQAATHQQLEWLNSKASVLSFHVGFLFTVIFITFC